MSSYNYKSIVSNTEATALKEMIFKRARERAESLDSEIKASYTDDIQSDVMTLARDSFVASKNPFSLAVEPKNVVEQTHEEKSETKHGDGLGFSQRKIDEVKSGIVHRNKEIGEDVSRKAVESNMQDARRDFQKKDSFIGALNFLNAQATIVLVNSNGKSFNAIA